MPNPEMPISFTLECLSNSADLGTPIKSIIGISQHMLDSQEPLTSNQRELLAMIREHAQILLYHFNNLLDASRVETGKLHLQIEDVDLIPLVEAITTAPFALFPWRKEVSIVGQVPDNLPSIRADKRQIRHTVIESIRLIATLCPAADELTMVFSYDDSWVRVKLKSLVSSECPIGGVSSIELFICKHLVELQGGEMTVENSDVLEVNLAFPVGGSEQHACQVIQTHLKAS